MGGNRFAGAAFTHQGHGLAALQAKGKGYVPDIGVEKFAIFLIYKFVGKTSSSNPIVPGMPHPFKAIYKIGSEIQSRQ
jgi:hypothetical protein